MKKEILVGDDIVIYTKVLTSLEEHQIPYKLGFKEGGYRIDKILTLERIGLSNMIILR